MLSRANIGLNAVLTRYRHSRALNLSPATHRIIGVINCVVQRVRL